MVVIGSVIPKLSENVENCPDSVKEPLRCYYAAAKEESRLYISRIQPAQEKSQTSKAAFPKGIVCLKDITPIPDLGFSNNEHGAQRGTKCDGSSSLATSTHFIEKLKISDTQETTEKEEIKKNQKAIIFQE
ncbi:hypothetical protein FQR65_LT10992 [Abscondita terminalis]|nr:hypothetical protein FQR65_LT10992 [Abscondita terminalis]